jgi:hypothetical protein
MIVIVQGDVDYGMKDEKGNAMTPEAALHMSKFRVRCEC